MLGPRATAGASSLLSFIVGWLRFYGFSRIQFSSESDKGIYKFAAVNEAINSAVFFIGCVESHISFRDAV